MRWERAKEIGEVEDVFLVRRRNRWGGGRDGILRKKRSVRSGHKREMEG